MRDNIAVTKFLSCIAPLTPCSLSAVGRKERTNLLEKVDNKTWPSLESGHKAQVVHTMSLFPLT